MNFSNELIAPCGINCGVCLAYLREKNKCRGCRMSDNLKSARGIKCGRKNCDEHKKSAFTYCFECSKFPCRSLKSLEKRYVEKYHLSIIGNLNDIKNDGLEKFVEAEKEKWTCKTCGAVLCVHRSYCLHCNQPYR